jgi:AFG3 family protein
MSERPNKNKNILPKTPQRPNYQVWIILSLAALVFFIFFFNQSSGVEEINEQRFEEIAKRGHGAGSGRH